MYVDLPVVTRCCFCAPLRIGLLSWGYIKLVLSILQWFWVDYIDRHDPLFVIIITSLLEVTDVIFTIILIIAAHKKHEKLFYVYHIYSMVYLVLLVIASGSYFIFIITRLVAHSDLSTSLELLIVFLSMIIAIILVQVYIVLLVRSELFKLRNITNIQYTNQANEAQIHIGVEKV